MKPESGLTKSICGFPPIQETFCIRTVFEEGRAGAKHRKPPAGIFLHKKSCIGQHPPVGKRRTKLTHAITRKWRFGVFSAVWAMGILRAGEIANKYRC